MLAYLRFVVALLFVLLQTTTQKSTSNADSEDLRSYNLKDIIEYGEKEQYIRYDPHSKTLCNPAVACKDIDIKTIPFVFDHVSERFINTQKFFDTKLTNKCLKNKRITLLGDSTMIEVANDLAVLMSGLASDHSILEKYLYRTTHVDETYSSYKLMNHVKEDYYGNHRNMSIYSDQTDTYIRSRFIGHYDLSKDDFGILTLIEDSFQGELFCLLGFNGCPTPDFVVINSGYHDRRHPIKQFKKIVFQFLHDLKDRYNKEKKAVNIIWAGTIIGTQKWKAIVDLDNVAEKVMEALKIPYMNSTDVIQYVPQFHFYPGMYTPDFIHYGSVAKKMDGNITGAVSMLKTQRILNEICYGTLRKKLEDSKTYSRTAHVQVI